MSKTGRVEAEIDPALQQAAEAVFAKLGMSPSDAIRIFYQQVELHQGLPFELHIPNAETLAAMREGEQHPERLRRYRNVDEMFTAWDADEAEC